MLGKSHFYETDLVLFKTIAHKFWNCKNDFGQLYIKLTWLNVWGGAHGGFHFEEPKNYLAGAIPITHITT